MIIFFATKIIEDKRWLKTVRHLRMTKPHVTALITAYNQVQLLCNAIDNVLAQDYPATNFEVIVVDDGSTDNTRNVIKHKYGIHDWLFLSRTELSADRYS